MLTVPGASVIVFILFHLTVFGPLHSHLVQSRANNSLKIPMLQAPSLQHRHFLARSGERALPRKDHRNHTRKLFSYCLLQKTYVGPPRTCVASRCSAALRPPASALAPTHPLREGPPLATLGSYLHGALFQSSWGVGGSCARELFHRATPQRQKAQILCGYTSRPAMSSRNGTLGGGFLKFLTLGMASWNRQCKNRLTANTPKSKNLSIWMATLVSGLWVRMHCVLTVSFFPWPGVPG